MKAWKAATACVVVALTLAWFIALDASGIEPGWAVLGWVVAGPLLLYPILGTLVSAAAREAERAGAADERRKGEVVLNHLRGQANAPVRNIRDACDRLIARCRAGDVDVGRVDQESAAILYELMRLQDALGRGAPAPRAPAGAAGTGVGSAASDERAAQEGRAVTGYVRRAVGVANSAQRG